MSTSMELDGVVSNSGSSKSLRILLVEDNADFREIVRDVLMGADFEVVALADGQEALDVMAQERFDVVLTDLRLPGADGLEIVRSSRFAPGAPSAVVMTAFPGWRVAEEARSAGAAYVLSKPFALGQLERILRELGSSQGEARG